MHIAFSTAGIQIPLIKEVDIDEILIRNSPNQQWYLILNDLDWRDYRQFAADYYNSLYHFNKFKINQPAKTPNQPESKEQAAQRLCQNRVSFDNELPVLYLPDFITHKIRVIQPEAVCIGHPPLRDGGPKPYCFFALFKSFLGAPLLGRPAEPKEVFNLLCSNPIFARVCGFQTLYGESREKTHIDIPQLRKLEQFDQIMREYGIWNRMKWSEVTKNIESGVIVPENIVVGDTSHFPAYSSFETISIIDEKGHEIKKSQSKPVKTCGCQNKSECPHPFVLNDDGAGTIVKNKTKIIWGHKASVVGLPKSGVILDASAVSDAAVNDGRTFLPHILLLFDNIPQTSRWFDTALYDRACDSSELKDQFQKTLNIQLRTSVNPRRIQTVTEQLPAGMARLTPSGRLFCKGGHEMEYLGIRYETERYLFSPPCGSDGNPLCPSCPFKQECCPLSERGRWVVLRFDLLPHINPKDPPMSKRFKAMMTLRPSVERMIKRIKCDLGDERLSKRGNASFQAYLDKTLIAYQILLRN